jgi:hypothetical protein
MRVEDAVKLIENGTTKQRVLRFLEHDHPLEIFRLRDIQLALQPINIHTTRQAVNSLYTDGMIKRHKIGDWNFYGSKTAINLLLSRLIETENLVK